VEWLCRWRRDYSNNADVGTVRRCWPRLKEQIKDELHVGSYRFSLLSRESHSRMARKLICGRHAARSPEILECCRSRFANRLHCTAWESARDAETARLPILETGVRRLGRRPRPALASAEMRRPEPSRTALPDQGGAGQAALPLPRRALDGAADNRGKIEDCRGAAAALGALAKPMQITRGREEGALKSVAITKSYRS
jgi:hypothetical protein